MSLPKILSASVTSATVTWLFLIALVVMIVFKSRTDGDPNECNLMGTNCSKSN